MQPDFNPIPTDASISGEQPPQPRVVTVTRLSTDVYQKFESSLPRAVIDRNALDAGCDASYKLGIQYILSKLREALVVE